MARGDKRYGNDARLPALGALEQRLDWLSSHMIADAAKVLRVRLTPERVEVMHRWLDEQWLEESADYRDSEPL